MLWKDKNFIFNKYYERLGCTKENSYYSKKTSKKKKDLQLFGTKLIEKNNNPSNSKEYYQSYLKKKKIVKRIKNNCSATSNLRKPIYCWHNISYYRSSKNIW